VGVRDTGRTELLRRTGHEGRIERRGEAEVGVTDAAAVGVRQRGALATQLRALEALGRVRRRGGRKGVVVAGVLTLEGGARRAERHACRSRLQTCGEDAAQLVHAAAGRAGVAAALCACPDCGGRSRLACSSGGGDGQRRVGEGALAVALAAPRLERPRAMGETQQGN